MSNPFLALPWELVCEVCTSLTPRDFLTLALVSHSTERLFYDEILWRKIVQRCWPDVYFALSDLPDTPEKPLIWPSRWVWSLESRQHRNFFGLLEKYAEMYLVLSKGGFTVTILRDRGEYECTCVSQMLRFCPDPDQLALAAYVTKRLCYQNHFKERHRCQKILVKHSTVAHLVQALRRYPEHELLARDGFGALGNLTLQKTHRVFFDQLKGGVLLLESIQRWHGMDEAERNVLFCIGNAVSKTYVLHDIMTSDLLGLMMRTMKRTDAPKNLLNQICVTMRNLTHADSTVSIEFVRKGGLPILMALLWRYQGDPLIDGNGLLLNLTATKESFEATVEQGLFKYLHYTLAHRKNEELTQMDVGVLCNIGWHNKHHDKIAEYKFVDIVCDVLHEESTPNSLIETATVFLGHMARNSEDGRRRAVELGAIERFLCFVSVDTNFDVMTTIAWALNAFHNSVLADKRAAVLQDARYEIFWPML